jgi:hypothetical protein
VYHVTLEDIEKRFTWNAKRLSLFRSLKRALANLAVAGVRRVWIDGSFVTTKQEPKDIDGCWEYDPAVVDARKIDPVLAGSRYGQRAMKRKYGIDFFIAGIRLVDRVAHELPVEEFFQRIDGGDRKGILVVEIGELR